MVLSVQTKTQGSTAKVHDHVHLASTRHRLYNKHKLHRVGLTAGILAILSMYTDMAMAASTTAADIAIAADSDLPN